MMKVLWASLLLLLVLCQMSLTRALDDDELRDNQGVNDDDAVIPGSQVRVTFTLPPRDTPNATEAPGNATNATMAPTDPCANYTGPEMVLVTLSLSNSTGNDTATWDNSTTSDGVDGNSTASNMTAMPTNATYEYVYDDLYYLCTPADDSSNVTEGGNFTNTSRTEVPASTPGAASGQTSFTLPPQTIPPTESPTQGSQPTPVPTVCPTRTPTRSPTRTPTKSPTRPPTRTPTNRPSSSPTFNVCTLCIDGIDPNNPGQRVFNNNGGTISCAELDTTIGREFQYPQCISWDGTPFNGVVYGINVGAYCGCRTDIPPQACDGVCLDGSDPLYPENYIADGISCFTADQLARASVDFDTCFNIFQSDLDIQETCCRITVATFSPTQSPTIFTGRLLEKKEDCRLCPKGGIVGAPEKLVKGPKGQELTCEALDMMYHSFADIEGEDEHSCALLDEYLFVLNDFAPATHCECIERMEWEN